MDLSTARFERIVEQVYATLEEGQAWRALLESLSEALDTRAIHLLGIDMRRGLLTYSEGARMTPELDLEYIQRYQFIDPRVAMASAPGFPAWIHCHEHFDEKFVLADRFYQEFLLPNGGRYLSGLKLHQDGDALVFLACIRSQERGPLEAEGVAFVERLRPHLERVCRLGIDRFVYSTQALVGHTLINQLRQPVILMTSTGEVIQTNRAADRLLCTTRLVRIDQGRLWLPYRELQALLHGAQEMEAGLRARAPGHACAQADRRSFRAAEQAGGDCLYGFYSVLVPEQVMGSFGLRPLVMLYLYHPDSAHEVDAGLLSAAFGLTLAECRIAALLADGKPLREIAECLGVQYETVRTQLKSIFQKTATNRQPELVRLLMNLPPARLTQMGDAVANS
jgi:DNA-binding CsgD family transcriptional regulator/PAS domain-containing protein